MPRKYDEELIKQLAQQPPKPPGGRPRKFNTPEEKRAADAESHRIAARRAKLIAQGEPLQDDLKLKRARRFMSDEERIEARHRRDIAYCSTHTEARGIRDAVYRMRQKMK